MLKLLRKYQKIMLAIFICVLMIAFVAPQAIRQLKTNPMNMTAATIDGASVTAGDIQHANAEVRVLDSINPLILPAILGVDQTSRGEHWLLLSHEARKAGFIGDAADGRAFIDDVAFQSMRLMLQQQFGQFADQAMQMPQFQERTQQMATEMAASVGRAAGPVGMTEQEGLRTLAAARGVMRLKDAYFAAARPSPAQAIATARRYGDAATINYVLLKGSSLAHEIPAPTTEELTAHFERFKDVEPRSGELGIGYRQAPRIKVEWLALERAQIAGAITPDRVELRKLYDANRATYTGEYEVERERVKADYLARRADEIMEEIARVVRAEVLRSARRLEQDGPYKKLPATWATDRPRLEAIAQTIVQTIAQSKGVQIPLPRVEIRDAEWLDQAGIAGLPGIGSAAVRAGNNEVPFSAFAFQVRELGGNSLLGLQAGLTEINSPAQDAAGNRYYFTVLDARAASAPESMAEVSTLEADWRSLRGYERLVAELPMYEQLAQTDSLEAVGQLVAGEGNTPAIPMVGVEVGRDRVQTTDTEVNVQSFRDAVMDAAAKLDPRSTPEQLATAPGTTLSSALPLSRCVVIARIKALAPLTVEQYRGLAIGVAYRSTMLEVQEVMRAGDANPFGLAVMRERLKFKEREKPQAQKEATPAAPAPDAANAPAPAPSEKPGA